MKGTVSNSEIRRLAASASRFKDPVKARRAAFKAWRTIRDKRRRTLAKGTRSLLEFHDEVISLPPGVSSGTYTLAAPLVKKSKLTYVARGGVGKELSDGWALNFAIGCTFGCRFCYVDEVHKKWGSHRAGNMVFNDWGYYFAIPENLEELIQITPWRKWKGEEVMLSSMHDAFLPQLHKWTTKMLEKALPEGVRFCIQTRSPLVEKDLALLREFRDQIRLQVSIATFDQEFSRIIEPRVVPPMRRVEILSKAKEYGLTTGVIVAPVFPAVKIRPNLETDLDEIADALSKVKPRFIYGESVHVRGLNLAYSEAAVGENLILDGFDSEAERLFHESLRRHGLKGTWWPEYSGHNN